MFSWRKLFNVQHKQELQSTYVTNCCL